ncbi:MAG: phospholipase D-like domain-containing protein [Steroidobacteraceae bacterium]
MKHKRRWILRSCLALLFCAGFAIGWWHGHKPLPAGLHIAGNLLETPTANLQLLTDRTAADAYGRPLIEQQIFDSTLALIASSRDLLVLDYFLFNDHQGALRDNQSAATAPRAYRTLSGELRDALLARSRAEPALSILLLIDPINLGYGTRLTPEFDALRRAGIDVVPVNLDALRDSNPVWSGLWRLAIRWWAPSDGAGSLPNLLDSDGDGMRVGAFARLLNFKADHRKLVIAGDGSGSLTGIVSSANPHDASSAHSNVGLRLHGPSLVPLLESALQIARLSGWRGNIDVPPTRAAAVSVDKASVSRVAISTEGATREALVQRIEATQRGDLIDLAMFYLTDRQVIRALLEASSRGVAVRAILDPNKDAFGHEKNGVPNRQVASELVTASEGAIRVRWYRTHGEQFHAKLVAISSGGQLWLTLGSANLTSRNLGDYNLEANVMVETPLGGPLAGEVNAWFESLWTNRVGNGTEYTADLDVYADSSQGRYWLYRLMEASGMSTF